MLTLSNQSQSIITKKDREVKPIFRTDLCNPHKFHKRKFATIYTHHLFLDLVQAAQAHHTQQTNKQKSIGAEFARACSTNFITFHPHRNNIGAAQNFTKHKNIWAG
jgi:hypothetical protein